MPRAVRFYRSLGFEVLHGGDESSFTSFRAGTSYLNLIAQPAGAALVLVGPGNLLRLPMLTHFTTVHSQRDTNQLPRPATPNGGERFFHLTDPDGHELSFARPLLPVSVQ